MELDSQSREPLQNKIATDIGGSLAWKILGSDSAGNAILLDGIGFTKRFDYVSRIDGQPVYIGYANPGTAEGTPTWLIQFYEYMSIGGTDFVSSIKIATDSWTGRNGATYK